jgi:Putative MetA-pathway of phenol degradation
MAGMRGHLLILAATLLAASAPAAAADEQPICPDRPSKSTGACTVPAGRWQVETSLVDWSHDSASDFTTVASSLIKFGVTDRADIELGVTPFESLRTHDTHQQVSSFGDLVARAKYRLTSDNAPVQVALDPFVKLPTASHRLGNGKVEGGLLVATSVPLGKSGLTFSLDPELDILADEDGHGWHSSMIQVLNLGASLNRRVSVSAELWGQWNWDPGGTQREKSADASIAYLVNNNLQLDAGANFGLNSQTPDIEVYSGLSVRF